MNLQEEQRKRILAKFNEKETKKCDEHILILIKQITTRISQSEENINKLSYSEKKTDKSSYLMKENMRINLIEKLKVFTKKVQKNEEDYLKKYQDLVGEEVKYHSYETKRNLNSNGYSTNNSFLKIDHEGDLLRKRDVEINSLLDSVNQLASVFKDMKNLVLEQG